MNSGKQPTARERRLEASVPELYAAMQKRQLRDLGGDLLAIHFGLWGPDTADDREALVRANRTLVQGCDLGPGRRVLDAGCGVGEAAIRLAETQGVHVTGITICEPHVAQATEQAEQRGVGHLVEFLHGDFMDLPFPDASFDAVLNQESFCYAADKLAYLQGVYRVLKPGGRWQCLDGLRRDTPLSESLEEAHAIMQRGWCMPPVATLRDVIAALKEAGFTEISEQDLSSEAVVSMDKLSKRWILLTMVAGPTVGSSPEVQGFMEAGVNLNYALKEGAFTYNFISGVRPMRDAERNNSMKT